MTKDEALKLALDALIWTTGSGDFGEGGQAHEGAKKCLFPAIAAIKEALAQTQEPVAWITPDGEGFRIRFSPPTNDVPLGWDALYTNPPQRTEQNFCSRCGKRTNDIHTCTPPHD